MSFDLSTVAIREPAVLIRDPLGTPSYFWSQKEFQLKPVVEYFDVPAAVHATAEQRIKSLYWQIDTTFVGAFEHLPVLFPLLDGQLGASILGTTDTAWRLITQSGRQWDFPRAGFIKRPTLTSVPGKTLLGPSTFAAVCASNKEPGASGAFYTYTTGGTFPAYTSYDPSKILTLAPLVTYGSVFTNAQGSEGIEITLDWKPDEVRANQLIRDWTLGSQELTAKFKPYGLTFEQIATACGYNLAMGAILPTALLTVSYTGFYVELRGASCKEAQFKIGPSTDFIDGLVFRASQTYSAGAPVAPGYIDVEAP
ncbi:MAG: hypothetical protein WAW39_16065 [Prosthecobacter sp.]|uniref:hypothetical protein n=1 Tax=Prosthecobacter sp. TaxID=1965333 RepID=UPI003BAF1B08